MHDIELIHSKDRKIPTMHWRDFADFCYFTVIISCTTLLLFSVLFVKLPLIPILF